jgi:cbb3-type cytochrome oxidase subunit 3
MKLSDVVSAMDVSMFAQVPLLVFMGVFLGVIVHVLRKNEHFEAARLLPLDGDGSRQEQDV